MGNRERVEYGVLVVAIFASFGILYRLIPRDVFLLCGVVGVGGALASVVPIYLRGKPGRRTSLRVARLCLVGVLAVPYAYAVTNATGGPLSLFSALLICALATVFFYYAFTLPLVLVSYDGAEAPEAEPPYPSVSVIVPAYNEAGCIGPSVEALCDCDYPAEKTEIIVVDDGSTDATAFEANVYADEQVTLLRKENGGKHSALNHGLDHASGEIVVTVDADSLLEPSGLRRIAGAFQADPAVGAVAGNITIANRGQFITELQELEYVVGIQLFRRAFDLCDTVTIVPGAFGAYRRSALEDVGRFDDDTLTEDFDATIKVLKSGRITRANEALCLTEAPETWRDLYNQRLRWYRGRTQTLLKHRDVFGSPRHGILYSLAFPIELFSNALLPFVGILIVVSIVGELLFGSVMQVLALFAFFTLLQLLVSALAVRIGDGDLRLAAFAPLFVLGYRQFLDAVMLKSVLDVLAGREMGWTGPERSGELAAALDRGEDEDPGETVEGPTGD
ncbi:glycosyltransferase [Halorientalis pallida]|uniref:glycosyltransferase n=1 Tax=Halorientalis pallida TaxID=2479928 RepID=UPI003C6FD78B